jgi:hypothetical protein
VRSRNIVGPPPTTHFPVKCYVVHVLMSCRTHASMYYVAFSIPRHLHGKFEKFDVHDIQSP